MRPLLLGYFFRSLPFNTSLKPNELAKYKIILRTKI